MRGLALLPTLLLASPAAAEVRSASANSFVIERRVDVSAPPQKLWASFGSISRWWNGEHSYSGDAKNLSLELRPGGCFCERLPGGGVEHMRVSYVDSGKRAVMTGALGPLLFEAVTGVMDVQVAPEGAGSRLTLTYRAAGFANSNAAQLAPLVDRVLGEQLDRLRLEAAR